MKTIQLVISLFSITSISFSQSGWVQKSSGINSRLRTVFFVNVNTGWAAGDSGKILRTTNGGDTWAIQNSNTTRAIDRVLFSDPNNGIAVGNYYEYNPWCFNNIIRLATTNGGISWSIQHEGYSSNIEDFSNSDINNNFFVAYEGSDCWGTVGVISKTSNNGINWIYLNTPGGGFAYKTVNFINSEIGWAIGYKMTDYGLRIHHLIKTTDGGSNWQHVRRDSNTYYQDYWGNNLRFNNSSTGYVMRLYERNLKKTTDGGFTWNQTDSIATAGKNAYHFINAYTGWCIGNNGSIIRTNNGGTNWISQNSNVTNSLHSIYFVDDYVGYIAGSNGIILKTITGGLTYTNQLTSLIPSSFILNQNFPNPFNPSTVIGYSLSEYAFSSLRIYNSLGKEVMTLINQNQNAGYYEATFDASNLSSGIYYYSLYANGNLIGSKRMMLLK